MFHWHSSGDGLVCTACWCTFGASLPFVCAVTCLRRCGGYRLNPTPLTLDHGSTTLPTVQVNQWWPGWRKNARATPNIVSLFTAVRIRSPARAPRSIHLAVVTQVTYVIFFVPHVREHSENCHNRLMSCVDLKRLIFPR